MSVSAESEPKAISEPRKKSAPMRFWKPEMVFDTCELALVAF
jgi:hypothetical protein